MHNNLNPSETDFLKSLSLMFCLLAIWVFTHPYLGIYLDGRLYAVDALHHLFPENYKKDLFFLYGSPFKFTILSQIYAYIISLSGLDNATIALLSMGLLLWFFSACFAAHSLTTGATFWLFLLFLLALPGHYGSKVFSYGEPFLTPRLFSESLVLLSVGFLVRKKEVFSFLMLVPAVFIHPLISAAGLIIFSIFKSLDDKKWLIVPLFAILLAVIAAKFKIPPFSGILETMDHKWFVISNDRAEYLFLNNWSVRHFDAMLFDASLIGSALLIVTGKLRRLLSSSLITGLGCLALSWVGADLLHNVFFIQIQLWRCLWLMHLFAYLAGAVLTAALWDRSKFSRLLLIGYLTAWFALELTSFAGLLAVWVFLIHFYTSRISHKEIGVPGLWERFFYFAPFILGIYWLIHCWNDIYFASLIDNYKKTFYDYLQDFLLITRIVLVFGFLVTWKLLTKLNGKPVVLTIVSGLFFLNILLIYRWDQRTEWKKSIDREDEYSQSLFRGKIPTGSVVCWPDYHNEYSINKIWFLLRRASYADVVQGAGIFYSRGIAMKYAERSKKLKALNIFSDKRIYAPDDKTILPNPSFSGLIAVSQDPELDFIVLDVKYSYGVVDFFYDEHTKKKYFLYDCKLIRNFSNKVAPQSKI